MLKKLRSGLVVGIGYMLSPLSWWNDLFFNLPIAYLFGYGVSWIDKSWFFPGTVVGYWLSNVLGIVMMQWGATDLLFDDRPKNLKRDLLVGVGSSTLYTVAIASLVYFHILELPSFLTDL